MTSFRLDIESGGCVLGDLSLLKDPDGVAERIAQADVGAIEMLGGLLGAVSDAACPEGLVQFSGVVREEDESAQGALGDWFTELRSGRFVVQRRARLLEGELCLRVAGNAHRQPAV